MTPNNTVCLWFDRDALDAARFYATTIPDSSVNAVLRAPGDSMMTATPAIGSNRREVRAVILSIIELQFRSLRPITVQWEQRMIKF